ncbi:protein angel homolog 2 isoform X2 [Chrysemys picta bellii]|uniref:protein angel homolog 2 isoform X2 n=1 Tax=Chrysemys picta bellii TaxID=8478 RepID=UPI0032B2E70D
MAQCVAPGCRAGRLAAMEAWRCVRRGCSRHPMLPRHMQRLGRDWVAHWDSPQRFCWNSRISNSVRWADHYSWAPYLSTADFTVNWRPPHFFGPWRPPHFFGPWRPPHFFGPWRPPQYWNWQPDNFTHNSSFHLSNPNMKSEGDEPSSKRRRHSGQNDVCSPNEEISSSNQNEAVCLSTSPKNEKENTANTRGYHCEYKMRTGRKPDGCAICFKISKFNLISSNPVEFFRHDIPLLDRDNVGLVLLLQPRFHCKATAAVCIANTHLLYNPRRGDIKLTQLAMLLAEIASVAHQKDGRFCPIIICGDFNSVPGSPLYSFIKEGKLNYEGLPIGKVSGQEQFPRGQRILTIPIWPPSLGISQSCVYEVQQQRQEENTGEEKKEAKLEHTEEIIIAAEKFPSKLQHHFRLSSVYSHYLPESGVPEVTTCHSRSAVTVDYIFYSAAKDDSAAQPGAEDTFDGSLKLLGRLSLLTEQDLWTVNGLPNEHNSSDHLSLLAQFRLIEE